MKRHKCWVSWSTGKDSAFALQETLKDPHLEVCALFSVVTKDFDRVSMHGIRKFLLEQQAKSLERPLIVVEIPEKCTNEIYEEKMKSLLNEARQHDIDTFIFGDLFLEDVRHYREKMLGGTGFTPLFPLWNYGTARLAKELIQSGYKAIITCIDSKKLSKDYVGREFDEAFLKDLPLDVDPCGERGEFHTFVYDGPIFKKPIECIRDKVVEREGFFFIDLLPIV